MSPQSGVMSVREQLHESATEVAALKTRLDDAKSSAGCVCVCVCVYVCVSVSVCVRENVCVVCV